MPTYFFKIGTTDVTAYIDIQAYRMNRADVFSEWTDGNGVEHRQIYRTRIEGEFQVGFAKSTDFSAFMTLLSNQKTAGGYFPVSAYVGNTGTLETFSAFLEVENPEDRWDTKHSRQWQVSTVKVRQI